MAPFIVQILINILFTVNIDIIRYRYRLIMENKINIKAPSPTQLGDMPPSTVPDAQTQAVADFGELGFLAATYADLVAKGETALAAKTLAEFQKIYSYFHVSADGKTITFDYNEGAELGVVIDPNSDAFEILSHLPALSHPPTAADVGTYGTFWTSTTEITWKSGATMTIWERILEFFVDTKFTMGRNLGNDITNTSILLFYCSLASIPGAQVSGALDKFVLSVGYHDGALIDLGNIFGIALALCAHLHNDSTLDPDVINAGLNITTTDELYPVLGQFFSSVYQNWVKDYPVSEEAAWEWEARMFPYYTVDSTTVNALPENTDLERRTELSHRISKDLQEILDAHRHKRLS